MSQDTEIFVWFTIVKISYRLAASAAENTSFPSLSHKQTIWHSCTSIVYRRSNYKYKTAVINIIVRIARRWTFAQRMMGKKIFHSNSRDWTTAEQKGKKKPKVKQVPSTSLYRKIDIEIVHCDSQPMLQYDLKIIKQHNLFAYTQTKKDSRNIKLGVFFIVDFLMSEVSISTEFQSQEREKHPMENRQLIRMRQTIQLKS